MFCPFNGHDCNDKCAWYSLTANGCGVIEAAADIKSELEELNYNLREVIPEKRRATHARPDPANLQTFGNLRGRHIGGC